MKKTLAFFILTLMLFLTACTSDGFNVDISAYGDDEIIITGLLDEDFTITPHELSELELVSETVTGKSDKAGTVKPVGPTLETFLAQYGYSQKDFTSIRFTASDAYTIKFTQTSLSKREFILAVANGDKPLGQDELPLRLIVPDADSSQWVRMIVQIDFEW